MERMIDDENNEVQVHGSRQFLASVPGSSSACGWQMVEEDVVQGTMPLGSFWLKVPGDLSTIDTMCSLTLYGDNSTDRDLSIMALDAIITQARKAKNYLKRLKLSDEQSS